MAYLSQWIPCGGEWFLYEKRDPQAPYWRLFISPVFDVLFFVKGEIRNVETPFATVGHFSLADSPENEVERIVNQALSSMPKDQHDFYLEWETLLHELEEANTTETQQFEEFEAQDPHVKDAILNGLEAILFKGMDEGSAGFRLVLVVPTYAVKAAEAKFKGGLVIGTDDAWLTKGIEEALAAFKATC